MMQEEFHLPSPPSTTVMEDYSASSSSTQSSRVKGGKNSSSNNNKSNKRETFDDEIEIPTVVIDNAQPVHKAAINPAAIPIGSPDVRSSSRDPKEMIQQGHRFLGCLCDMRRTVIILNIISIVLAIVEIIFFSAFLAMYDQIIKDDTLKNNDDNVLKWFTYEDDMTKMMLGFLLFFVFVSIVFFSLGIHGARTFNRCMVICATVFHCVSAIVNLLSLNLFGMLFSVVWVYPHIMLLVEMKRGIMTRENYVHEKNGCCV